MRRGEPLALFVLAGVTVYAAILLARVPIWMVDDSYIVARYAENLIAQRRFVFNPGGPPVEGFTSLLSLLIEAGATALHIAPIPLMARVTELAFLSSGALVYGLGRTLRAPPMVAALVGAIHLTMAEHLTHATSGLETELFLALSLAFALVAARALDVRRGLLPVALLGFVLVITRPEGLASGFVALGVLLWQRRGAGLLAALGGFAAPLLGLFVWRWLTFGALQPNTFYAKSGTWNAGHLEDLWVLVQGSYLDWFLVSAAGFALAFLATKRRPARVIEARVMAFVAIVILALQALAYARTEQIMAFSRRFAMNDLPWIDVLALVVASAAVRALRPAPRALRWSAAVAPALGLFAVAHHERVRAPAETAWTRDYGAMMTVAMAPTIDWLVTHTSPDDTIAVMPDAGFVPYATKRRAIDFGYLNDPYLARAPHSAAVSVEYFFRIAPDAFVLAPPPHRVYDEIATAITSDPRFEERYVFALKTNYLLYSRRR